MQDALEHGKHRVKRRVGILWRGWPVVGLFVPSFASARYEKKVFIVEPALSPQDLDANSRCIRSAVAELRGVRSGKRSRLHARGPDVMHEPLADHPAEQGRLGGPAPMMMTDGAGDKRGQIRRNGVEIACERQIS